MEGCLHLPTHTGLPVFLGASFLFGSCDLMTYTHYTCICHWLPFPSNYELFKENLPNVLVMWIDAEDSNVLLGSLFPEMLAVNSLPTTIYATVLWFLAVQN